MMQESYEREHFNPFDFSEESSSSSTTPSEDLDRQVRNRQTFLLGRGALISGNRPGSESTLSQRDLHADVESSVIGPPESDYASTSLWDRTFRSRRQRPEHNLAPHLGEGEIRSEKRSGFSRFYMFLACLSVCLVGAIIAVAVVVYGGDDNNSAENNESTSMTTIQLKLSDVAVYVSGKDAFDDPNSPQGKARHWLVYEDSIWKDIGNTDEISAERVVQRYVLALFYFSTNGYTDWIEHDWLNGEECGDNTWVGLNCNENGQVRALAFDHNGLSGSIPTEIGYLSQLENLILKDEQGLIGSIPASIGKIAALKQLGLYALQLTGTIPEELFLATSLTFLNLEANHLTGTLSPKVGNLKNLTTLVLSANNLEGSIPFESFSATPIEYLGLSANGFTGTMPPSIAELGSLQYLYLDMNEMKGEIPSTISGLKNLKYLNLNHNKFAGTLPHKLGSLGALQYLSLQDNLLTGSLPSTLNNIYSLKTLNLALNKFSGEIPDLSKLKGLSNLVLFNNQLKGEIPSYLGSMYSLGTSNIAMMKLEGYKRTLSHPIEPQKTEILFLSSNNFTGSIPDLVGEDNDGAVGLKGLYLSANQLTGSIPTSICGLRHLQALFLDENKLNGTLPPCLDSLEALTQFYAFQNNLSGEIPTELSMMRSLVAFGVEDNNLSGQVPSSFCALADYQEMEFWSDCGGDTPELECSCCTVCCPSPQCI